tara:strand:- start:199 stop:690 length:492 start_codon:yes stop_codon:yes gene_type:complete
MSDTVDMNTLLKGFLDKGGVLVTGNNNTVVVGNYFAGSSTVSKKERAARSSTVQEDDFTVNPTQDVDVEVDLNRDSVDTTATADDKIKAEEIVRKLEALEEEVDTDGDHILVTDILFDAGDEGFDVAEKIIEMGLEHWDGVKITVDNIDAVNAILKEHYDDKK